MKCIVFAGLLASATAFIAPAPRVSVSVSLAGSEGGRGREGGREGMAERVVRSIKPHTYTLYMFTHPQSRSVMKMGLESQVGYDIETGGKPWDPFGLAGVSERNGLGILPHIKWLQESEVGIGREGGREGGTEK